MSASDLLIRHCKAWKPRLYISRIMLLSRDAHSWHPRSRAVPHLLPNLDLMLPYYIVELWCEITQHPAHSIDYGRKLSSPMYDLWLLISLNQIHVVLPHSLTLPAVAHLLLFCLTCADFLFFHA